MMKVVEKVNYQTTGGGVQPQRRQASQPSFSGTVNPQELERELKNLMPSSLKIMNKLAKNMGEAQNIIFNSLGTGLVAPIFIKWNPLSKTDEDTRTYSAWRQPISAVLAVVTQAGITAPFNTLINNMSNSGYLGEKYNKSALRDENYIKKLVKRESPHATKEQLKEKIALKKKEQVEAILTSMKNKNVIMLKNYKGETVPMSKNEYTNLLRETVEDMLKELSEKKKELKITRQKRMARSEYLRTHNAEAKKVLEEINDEFQRNSSLPSLKAYLKKKIKSLRSNKANPELIQMVKEVAGRAPAIKLHNKATDSAIINGMKGKVKKMLGHVEKYGNAKTAGEVIEAVENSIRKQFEAVQEAADFFDDIKKSITDRNATVAQIEQRFEEKFAQSKNKLLKKDFSAEVIEKFKKNVTNNLKGYKQIAGLIVSCAVLPFTCALLNWVYPIFMDAVFPNLSNKKHDNESSALVAKAPKKVEVN